MSGKRIGRKRSNLWLHFSIVSEDKAKCDICRAVLSHKGGTTSNLKKHLVAKHPSIELDETKCKQQAKQLEIVSPDEPSTSGTTSAASVVDHSNQAVASTSAVPDDEHVGPRRSPRLNRLVMPENALAVLRRRNQTNWSSFVARPASVARQKRLHNLLINMIVKDLQPFSIVDDEGFREFVAGLDPSYVLPSRTTLTRELLPQLYDKIIDEVKANLAKAEYITLTTDGWTSRTTESYIAVTAHFISDSWEMRSCLLECFKYGESHTAENLKDELHRVAADWGISDLCNCNRQRSKCDSSCAACEGNPLALFRTHNKFGRSEWHQTDKANSVESQGNRGVFSSEYLGSRETTRSPNSNTKGNSATTQTEERCCDKVELNI